MRWPRGFRELEQLELARTMENKNYRIFPNHIRNWIGQPNPLQEIALARAQRFVKGIGKITAIS